MTSNYPEMPEITEQLRREEARRKAVALLERVSRYLSGFVRAGSIEIIKDYNDTAPSLTIRIRLDTKTPLNLKMIYGEREY